MTFPLFLTSRRCLGSLLFALLLLCPLRAVWATQEVSFSFENTDISTVIKKVGEFTKTTFLFNPELVKGKLTLLAPQKVSPQAALRLLQSALALHGYRMVRKAAGTWIVPAGQGPVETLIEVVPLQYARVDELAYTLSWVAPAGGYGSCRMFPPIASSSQETQKRGAGAPWSHPGQGESGWQVRWLKPGNTSTGSRVPLSLQAHVAQSGRLLTKLY
jgi:hypothetical protein